MRVCDKCGLSKEEDGFYWRNKRLNRRRRDCKDCTKKRTGGRYATHKDSIVTSARRWSKANPEKVRRSARRMRLKYKGLTQDRYDRILSAQGGTCALCDETDDLCIDHDHSCCPHIWSCGRCVRGLLCRKHNAGLGHFNDDVGALDRAITYLKWSHVRSVA